MVDLASGDPLDGRRSRCSYLSKMHMSGIPNLLPEKEACKSTEKVFNALAAPRTSNKNREELLYSNSFTLPEPLPTGPFTLATWWHSFHCSIVILVHLSRQMSPLSGNIDNRGSSWHANPKPRQKATCFASIRAEDPASYILSLAGTLVQLHLPKAPTRASGGGLAGGLAWTELGQPCPKKSVVRHETFPRCWSS